MYGELDEPLPNNVESIIDPIRPVDMSDQEWEYICNTALAFINDIVSIVETDDQLSAGRLGINILLRYRKDWFK